MPYLFGYGSLISRVSAAKTLGRELSVKEHVDAVLVDHQICWDTPCAVLTGDDFQTQTEAVFLNIQPMPGTHCCGSVFHVTDDELAKFDLREKQYERRDVADWLIPAYDAVVYAYFRKPSVPEPSPDAVVMEKYVDIIDSAFTEKRASFQVLWRSGCAAHAFPIMPGAYRFDDPTQNKNAGR